MKKYNLDTFKKGWILGLFDPSLKETQDFEIAIKYYSKGDYESKHYHRFSTEYTCIIYGQVKMNGIIYSQKDIIVIDPGESTDFNVLNDTATVVIKVPSVPGDKFADVNI